MHHFQYKEGQLWAEDLSVTGLAETYGTPLYVYSTATLRRHYQAFDSAFAGLDHLTCFSAKANSNLSVLSLLGQWGAGVDIVSGGELYRALKAGIAPGKIVYSGVGKQRHEIEQALEADILMFNCESLPELELINAVAEEKGCVARVSLRINPDVDPQTHPYISTGLKKNKFGLDLEQSEEAYLIARDLPGVEPIGMDCHIGSQLTSVEPFLEALERLKRFYVRLQDMGLHIRYLDLGGGLGITYDEETPPHPEQLGSALADSLQGYDLTLILEPGRVIAGNAGIMVSKVLYTKTSEAKHFAVVDAAMNDLVRPSLYGAYHRLAEVEPHHRSELSMDIVGPICETGDFLAQDRTLPELAPGELIAAFSAGAYGFTMASQYNSRPRAAEVLVDGQTARVIRRRETYEDLIALETEALAER
ncbi:MAG: diaminopimelate decarboxylase [Thermodesulfobacteriota bacterium]